MPTPAIPTAVSRRFHLITLVAAAAVLGGCASGRRPVVWDASDVVADRPVTIHFDNEGEQAVDVYLVGERREWRLGRVVPGGIATLDIPAAAIGEVVGFVRLAVIEGGPPSARAARDPRARFSIAQPISELPRQRFAFSERQAGGPQLLSLQAGTGRP